MAPPSSGAAERRADAGAVRDELVVPRGAAIFRQGDPGDSLFLVQRGRVRILLEAGGHQTDVAVLERGAFFGELSLLSGAPRSATAEALEDATLLVIRHDVFAMMMQDDIDIVFRMLHTMGQRLERTDRQFRGMLAHHDFVRLLAEGLAQPGVAAGGSATSLTVERLASAMALDDATVRWMVGEVTRRGAGALENDCWRLDGAGHVAAALALLRDHAAARDPD